MDSEFCVLHASLRCLSFSSLCHVAATPASSDVTDSKGVAAASCRPHVCLMNCCIALVLPRVLLQPGARDAVEGHSNVLTNECNALLDRATEGAVDAGGAVDAAPLPR